MLLIHSVSYTHLDVYKRQVAVFVKCMDQVLGQEALQFTTVYVDDLLITSSDWEELCEWVKQVLKKLSENKITLKLDKSKFIACLLYTSRCV